MVILKLIVDAKANCNACSVHKATALHHATSGGSVDVTQTLLAASRSASLEAKRQLDVPLSGDTEGSLVSHYECAKLLLSLGYPSGRTRVRRDMHWSTEGEHPLEQP